MKPRLLDLFCGAGGCSVGYANAGFEVVGVDINPQPNYPFEFVQAHAFEVLHYIVTGVGSFKAGMAIGAIEERFDAIHASPPCQDYSRALRHLAAPQPRLIDPVKDLLVKTGLPWVIENVEGAPIPRHPDLFGNYGVELCGTSFGLSVYRHRLFESSFHIPAKPCNHSAPAMNPHNQAGRDRIYEEFGRQDPEVIWRKEMGVEWMSKQEGREAVPPVFTEHIGHYLLNHLRATAPAGSLTGTPLPW